MLFIKVLWVSDTFGTLTTSQIPTSVMHFLLQISKSEIFVRNSDQGRGQEWSGGHDKVREVIPQPKKHFQMLRSDLRCQQPAHIPPQTEQQNHEFSTSGDATSRLLQMKHPNKILHKNSNSYLHPFFRKKESVEGARRTVVATSHALLGGVPPPQFKKHTTNFDPGLTYSNSFSSP